MLSLTSILVLQLCFSVVIGIGGWPGLDKLLGKNNGNFQKSFSFSTSALNWTSVVNWNNGNSSYGTSDLSEQSSEFRLLNWGANFRFSTDDILYPTSTAEIQKIVLNAEGNVRPMGTRHSFSTIADSNDTIISMVHYNQILGYNLTEMTVTVQSGITYTDLAPFVEYLGCSLPMLASFGELSIGGAISTGAHGSGAGNLATQIKSFNMVLANGSLVTFTQGQKEFNGAVLSMGALGIIAEITLNIQPTFKVAVNLFSNLNMSSINQSTFQKMVSSAYSVQLFTDWTKPGVINYAWIDTRIGQGGNFINATNFFGAPAATSQSTPIAALPPTYLVEQLGSPGPWYQRLTDYELGLSGLEGQQTQSEYFVSLENAWAAIQAVEKLRASFQPIVYTSLYRTISPDNLWMSPSFNRTTVAIHFSWMPQLDKVMQALPIIEKALAPFNPVPHWAKLFTIPPKNFLKQYPNLKSFKNLAAQLDPNQKFRNSFLDENVFA